VSAPVHTDPVTQVRAIWAAYSTGGDVALRGIVDDGAEWVGLADEPPITSDVMYSEPGRRRARDMHATVHGYECHGECVLAHGSLRTFRERGFVDVQPSWVYFFRDGRLLRCSAYANREDALRAIAEFQAE
jgi:ketosteroid isomerase-like protein